MTAFRSQFSPSVVGSWVRLPWQCIYLQSHLVLSSSLFLLYVLIPSLFNLYNRRTYLGVELGVTDFLFWESTEFLP